MLFLKLKQQTTLLSKILMCKAGNIACDTLQADTADRIYVCIHAGLTRRLCGKNPPADAGDARVTVSVSGLGRSPGGGNDNPLQYSHLEIPRAEEPGGLQFMGHRVRHE